MSRIRDLKGQRFRKLIVVSKGDNDKNHRATWNCKCDCGKITNVKSANLISGKTNSCGCIRVNNLVGKKYGKLAVVSKEENKRSETGRSHVMYFCKCDCGKNIVVKAENLRSGNTKSCGCLVIDTNKAIGTKHGKAHTRLYNVWQRMKQRCYDANCKEYDRYGGRGITVCNEWLNDFQLFYDWAMDNGYDENAPKGECTIDRIDNDGNYCPENCRWVSNKEQQRNKKNNFLVLYKGEELPLSVVAEKEKINRSTLYSRLQKGMTIEEAILYKQRKRGTKQ